MIQKLSNLATIQGGGLDDKKAKKNDNQSPNMARRQKKLTFNPAAHLDKNYAPLGVASPSEGLLTGRSAHDDRSDLNLLRKSTDRLPLHSKNNMSFETLVTDPMISNRSDLHLITRRGVDNDDGDFSFRADESDISKRNEYTLPDDTGSDMPNSRRDRFKKSISKNVALQREGDTSLENKVDGNKNREFMLRALRKRYKQEESRKNGKIDLSSDEIIKDNRRSISDLGESTPNSQEDLVPNNKNKKNKYNEMKLSKGQRSKEPSLRQLIIMKRKSAANTPLNSDGSSLTHSDIQSSNETLGTDFNISQTNTINTLTNLSAKESLRLILHGRRGKNLSDTSAKSHEEEQDKHESQRKKKNKHRDKKKQNKEGSGEASKKHKKSKKHRKKDYIETDLNATFELRTEVKEEDLNAPKKRILITDGLNLVKILIDRKNRKITKLLVTWFDLSVLWSLVLNALELSIFATTKCSAYTIEGFGYFCFVVMCILKVLGVCLVNLELTNSQPYILHYKMFYPMLIYSMGPILQLPQNVYDFSSCRPTNRIITASSSWIIMGVFLTSTVLFMLYYRFRKTIGLSLKGVSILSRIYNILDMIIQGLILLSIAGWNVLSTIIFSNQAGTFLPSYFFDFYLYLLLCISALTFWRLKRMVTQDVLDDIFVKNSEALESIQPSLKNLDTTHNKVEIELSVV